MFGTLNLQPNQNKIRNILDGPTGPYPNRTPKVDIDTDRFFRGLISGSLRWEISEKRYVIGGPRILHQWICCLPGKSNGDLAKSSQEVTPYLHVWVTKNRSKKVTKNY